MAKAIKKDGLFEELERIRRADPDGMLHAEKVVAWAKAHPRSALHSQFEWTDSKAAREYRLWQARRVITLTINEAHTAPQIVSLRWDRPRGGGYRNTADVLTSEDLAARLLGDALADLERVRERHRHVSDLMPIWSELDKIKLRMRRPPAQPLRPTA